MDLNQTENEYIVRNNKRSLKVSDKVSKEFKSSYLNDAVENSLKNGTRVLKKISIRWRLD